MSYRARLYLPYRGRRSPATIALLLGRLYRSRGLFSEAAETYSQALVDFGDVQSQDYDALAALLSAYLSTLGAKGRLHTARPVYDNLIHGARSRLSKHHDAVLQFVLQTGRDLQRFGLRSEAERLYQETLNGIEVAKHTGSATLLCIMGELGVLLSQQGKFDKAAELQYAVLNGYLNIYRDYYNPWVLNVVLTLATTFRDKGSFKEAIELFKWASSGLQQTLGTSNIATINSFFELAKLQSMMHNFVDAELAFLSCLSGCEAQYGKDGKETLQKRTEYAVMLRDHGKLSDALAICRLLEEKYAGTEESAKYVVMNCQGTIHSLAGEFEEAESKFAGALAGFCKYGAKMLVFGPVVLYNMGNMFQGQGKPTLAERPYREALHHAWQIVGRRHTVSLSITEMLGTCLISQGRDAEAAEIYSDSLVECSNETELPTTATSAAAHAALEANFHWMTTSYLPSYYKLSTQKVTETPVSRSFATGSLPDAGAKQGVSDV